MIRRTERKYTRQTTTPLQQKQNDIADMAYQQMKQMKIPLSFIQVQRKFKHHLQYSNMVFINYGEWEDILETL